MLDDKHLSSFAPANRVAQIRGKNEMFINCFCFLYCFCAALYATVGAYAHVHEVIDPESWFIIDELVCEEYLPQKPAVFWYTRYRHGPQYTKAKLELDFSATPQSVSFYIVDTQLL